MRTVFLTPVIHPAHPIVSDYDLIERILKLTVTSLLRQTCREVGVAIAAHRRPEWAEDFADRVTFLTLPDHPDVAPERYPLVTDGDPGLKRTLAGLHALRRWAPDYFVLMDADDFMNVSLADLLHSGRLGPGGTDGYLLTEGYHAIMRRSADGFQINGALRVREFNETCGSCRIFHAAAFKRLVARIDPSLLQIAHDGFAEGGAGADLTACIERIAATADRMGADPANPLRLVGSHVALWGHLDLALVGAPLAAKGCGHSTHYGPRGGEIHWSRSIGALPISTFRSRFGLDLQEDLVSAPDWRVQTREAIAGPARRVLRRLNAIRAARPARQV